MLELQRTFMKKYYDPFLENEEQDDTTNLREAVLEEQAHLD